MAGAAAGRGVSGPAGWAKAPWFGGCLRLPCTSCCLRGLLLPLPTASKPPCPSCDRLAALLEQHGFYAAGEWMAAWEAAWRSNLDSCDESGHCMIQVT